MTPTARCTLIFLGVLLLFAVVAYGLPALFPQEPLAPYMTY